MIVINNASVSYGMDMFNTQHNTVYGQVIINSLRPSGAIHNATTGSSNDAYLAVSHYINIHPSPKVMADFFRHKN